MDWKAKIKELFESLDSENLFPEGFVSGIVEGIGTTISEIEVTAKSEAKELYEHRAQRKIQEVKAEANKRVSELLEQVDTEHAEMLEQVFNAQDEAHAKAFVEAFKLIDTMNATKLEESMQAIDADHSEKILKVKEIYEAKEINSKLLEKVSSFINTYLEKTTPKEALVNEAKLKRYEAMHEQAKVLFSVSDDYMQNEVKGAISEAEVKITSLEEKNLELVEGTVTLSEKIKTMEAATLLENKLRDLPHRELTVMTSIFEGKSKEEIVASFDEELSSFRETESARRSHLKEKAQYKSKVPTTKKQKIEEAVFEVQPVATVMDQYVDMLSTQTLNTFN